MSFNSIESFVKASGLNSTTHTSICSSDDKPLATHPSSFTLFVSKNQSSNHVTNTLVHQATITASCRFISLNMQTGKCLGDTVDVPSPTEDSPRFRCETLDSEESDESEDDTDLELEVRANSKIVYSPEYWYLYEDIPLDQVLNHGVTQLLRICGNNITYKDFEKCFLPSKAKASFSDLSRYRLIEGILKRPFNNSILASALSNKGKTLSMYQNYGFQI